MARVSDILNTDLSIVGLRLFSAIGIPLSGGLPEDPVETPAARYFHQKTRYSLQAHMNHGHSQAERSHMHLRVSDSK